MLMSSPINLIHLDATVFFFLSKRDPAHIPPYEFALTLLSPFTGLKLASLIGPIYKRHLQASL
jgi:hypothetical protein